MLVEAGPDARVERVRRQVRHDADAQPRQVAAAGRAGQVRRRLGQGRGVLRVVAGDDLLQRRGVGHGAGGGADLVQ